MKVQIPIIARGNVNADYAVTHKGRRGGFEFQTPDAARYLNELVLTRPSAIKDQYVLTFEDILDYLEELGSRLVLEKNPDLQLALEISQQVSGLPDSVLQYAYEGLHSIFRRETVREIAESRVGVDYLEGWVPQQMIDGRTTMIRAFGARSVHVVAGNLPNTSAMTIMRNAITRGDALIKTPSNDPMTAVAIAKTMIHMAPDHPLTKHVAVAYWRGGDEQIEDRLYQPRNIEKIVAWGGFASVKHISQYLQPGIDLITLDPKLSASIVANAVFDSEDTMTDVAQRLATDIATFNQEACVNARVIYVECGDDASIARLNRLGEMVQERITQLPSNISNTPKDHALSRELSEEVSNLRFGGDAYRVFGNKIEDGTVIVSQYDDPVDFASLLENRVANLVPVQSIEDALNYLTMESQTIGVYPESLKTRIADDLAFHGGQRIVSLGYACHFNIATPQDGIEPIRRMCKWIFQERCDPESVPPLWQMDQPSTDNRD